jgi:uncharacterized membrane protein YjjB (DUF3815 family)
MFTDIYLPDLMYRAWPWLCVAAAGVAFALRQNLICSMLIAYTAWVVGQRLFSTLNEE